MRDPLVLSRHGLDAFSTCKRRYQLRYREQLAWPAPPSGAHQQRAQLMGERFHRMLERHFLGLHPTDRRPGAEGSSETGLGAEEAELRAWWEVFQRSGPTLPPGERLAEYTLTAPLGGHFLVGRYDLLQVGADDVHIYDWKTEQRPRSRAELAADIGTRLYLALAVEGGAALRPTGPAIAPERVRLTYWYVRQPEASVTLPYDRAAHDANMAWLEQLVAAIATEVAAAAPVWPLTTDWDVCGRCQFRILCGRQGAPVLAPQEDLERDEESDGGDLWADDV